MLYHVKTGDLDIRVHATSHRHAATRALMDSDEDFGVCVAVSEGWIDERSHEGIVFFLTESILEERHLKVVG